MFPQGITWSLKPRVSSETPISKGKGIAGNHDSAAAPPPPPLESLNGRELNRGGEDMEVWKRFKEEGLDESLFHKKGREALASTILELNKELRDYQHTMGLLLIEKKEWSSNMEDLKARLAEAEENLKREKAAHIIALTESGRREDNLCKSLGVEMQCVSDLEKALGEMQSENAEIKLAYEKKMAEAHALEASMENLQKKEKELLEVEEKLNHREREEIRKLLDEHNATLDAKKKEFELELESKRKSIEEELISKFDVVNRVEKEVNHKQELINKRERELESKMNEIEIKEKDLETESDALKNWEESLKLEEKKLIVEKDQIMKDTHELKVSINELQSLRDALKAEEHQIAKDRENLEISKEERKQYIQKQYELKQEIEMNVNMKEDLSKEIDSLREEREKLEKERGSLNVEKLMLQGETKKINLTSQSLSLSIGEERRKKHKTSTASGEQTPIEEKRYNLRPSTIAKNSGATTQAVSDPSSFTK